jgi:hypothetical protein
MSKVKAIFKSVWDGNGLGYDSSCEVDTSNGEVLSIEMIECESIEGESLERQELRMQKASGEIITLEIDNQQWENFGSLFIAKWEAYRRERFVDLD